MKLVFIHGPPAVGKLSVAKELSKLTGYKIFHNHLALDFVESIFTPNKKVFWGLVNEFRLKMLESAAKEKLKGVIFTSGYDGKDVFIKKLIKRIKIYKGKIYFVYLYCDQKMLFKRVKGISRKKYLKTVTIKKLKENLNNRRFFNTIPNVKTLKIDNTNLSAKKVAEKIKRYYKL